jgi:DNA-binding CsgD family transcriptional regulator
VRLSESDARRLSQVAYELGQPTPLPDLPRRIVGLVGTLVASDCVALTEVLMAEGRTQGYMEPDESWVREEEASFGALFAEHPIIQYYQRTGDGGARCISDFLTPYEFHSRALYQAFYQRLGAEEQLAASFTAGPDVVIGLTFNRGTRTFTERDRLVVDILGPVVAAAHHRSYETWRAAQLLQAESGDSAPQFADGSGLVVLDEGMNPLQAWGLPGALMLEAVSVEELGRLARGLVRRALNTGTITLTGRRYQVTLLPGAVEGHDALALQAVAPPSLAAALSGYGLTPRECEALGLLATGATDREIARELAIAVGTVRAHVGRILLKLNVGSRTAAVALALRAQHPAGD